MKRSDPNYWEWRKNVGRPKDLDSPTQLWDLACEYFKRVDENPYMKQDFIKGGERAGQIIELETIMPYTWAGLDDYVLEQGITANLQEYRSNSRGAYSEFSDVVAHINQIMYNQKFSGAAVGAFNSSIISRDLGLVEKNQSTIIEQPLFGDEK